LCVMDEYGNGSCSRADYELVTRMPSRSAPTLSLNSILRLLLRSSYPDTVVGSDPCTTVLCIAELTALTHRARAG
jgi:hypothetical protein